MDVIKNINKPIFIIDHKYFRGYDPYSEYYVQTIQKYYEDVLDLIDELLETYQGQYGIVDGYDVIDTNDTRTKEKVEYFEGLAEFVKHGRKAIVAEDTHLHSIIDDIVVLIYRTLYKLKFTK